MLTTDFAAVRNEVSQSLRSNRTEAIANSVRESGDRNINEENYRKPKAGSRKPLLSNFAKLVTLQLLRAYKWAISPLFPPACRYVPTCSEYAMEAVERFGALRGGWMAFTRILRCHPFARSGYDPVVKQATDHGKL